MTKKFERNNELLITISQQLQDIETNLNKINEDDLFTLQKIHREICNISRTPKGNFFKLLYNSTSSKIYTGGQRFELELQERFKNKLFLDGFGYKVYSQNDEDGIINEIFNRIGTTNKKFIEIGIENGSECNSHLLLDTGWSGLWIEGNSEQRNLTEDTFKKYFQSNKISLVNAFITKDNINNILEENTDTPDLDLFSLDIDGNDWYVMKSILEAKKINPRVIILEYNPLIPPSVNQDDFSTDFIMEYDENWHWPNSEHPIDYYGASLSAFYHLLKEYDYQLVGTCTMGVNAFFVKKELTEDKFPTDTKAAATFYNPYRLLTRYITAGHLSYQNMHFAY